MSDEPPAFVNLCTAFVIPEEKELEEFVDEFAGLDYPEFLPWTDSFIDYGKPDEFQVIISNGPPEPPRHSIDRSVFQIEATTSDDGELGFHIHSYIQQRHYSDLVDFHNVFASMDVELKVNHSTISLELPVDLSELQFEVSYPFDAELNGIGFWDEPANIQFFKESESSFISVGNVESESDTEDVENHIEATRIMANEYLEKVLP